MAIYVDLDGTLAEYHGWNGGAIGPPVPSMLARVRAWIEKGEEVVIFTARACLEGRNHADWMQQKELIQGWLRKHGLPDLRITAVKGFDGVEFWDDRAIQVVPNTGRRADGKE
jgi:hypothetical protein